MILYQKEYVDVLTRFEKNGTILPLCVYWIDGTEYPIDRIVDIRRASSLRAGGFGIRYECEIRGHRTFLFLEGKRWFAERKLRTDV